eukprot:jgi/Chlat1/5510/Chrsp360S05338
MAQDDDDDVVIVDPVCAAADWTNARARKRTSSYQQHASTSNGAAHVHCTANGVHAHANGHPHAQQQAPDANGWQRFYPIFSQQARNHTSHSAHAIPITSGAANGRPTGSQAARKTPHASTPQQQVPTTARRPFVTPFAAGLHADAQRLHENNGASLASESQNSTMSRRRKMEHAAAGPTRLGARTGVQVDTEESESEDSYETATMNSSSNGGRSNGFAQRSPVPPPADVQDLDSDDSDSDIAEVSLGAQAELKKQWEKAREAKETRVHQSPPAQHRSDHDTPMPASPFIVPPPAPAYAPAPAPAAHVHAQAHAPAHAAPAPFTTAHALDSKATPAPAVASTSAQAPAMAEAASRSSMPASMSGYTPSPSRHAAPSGSAPDEMNVDAWLRPGEPEVMLDREVLLASDERRLADEEEWERRRIEIQRQAEEVQQLRKRKKAEAERNRQMAERQEQRLLEYRQQVAKAANENDTRERIRSSVLADLKRRTERCYDLAGVLRALGIPVEGGPLPTKQQLQSGFKKALLKFHPDRHKGELQDQVRAEECFKLIKRWQQKQPL